MKKLGIVDFKREKKHFGASFEIIGCDEVGRGCIAGPVVAAAVIFDWSKPEEIRNLARAVRIDDSKKLSKAEREEADKEIRKIAKSVKIGVVSVGMIDKINILQASLRAMRQAIGASRRGMAAPCPYIALIDGNQKIAELECDQEVIIGGDGKVFSIAAASIVAKVYRDRLMVREHKKYPKYDWEKNKGYGTAFHKAALLKFGLTPLHRKTFCHIDEVTLG
jgi:ribonuclease HII